jgi:hypothetical protein
LLLWYRVFFGRVPPRVFFRRQDRVQRVAFLPGPEFHDGVLFHVFNQTLQNLPSQSGSRHFPTTEKNRRLDLVSVVQEAQHMILFGLVIVVVHIDAELYFLHHDFGLVLLGFAFFLFLLVKKFPVVHDAANGRNGGRRDFHQIQVLLTSQFKRVEGSQNTNLLTLIPDNANFPRPDAVICADKTFIDTILRQRTSACSR